MAKTRSTTRNQNHDDSSSRKKRFNTCDNHGVSHWSELSHDMLFLVTMQLGIFDFVSFSGVCKSWRSFALCNMKRFMALKPPMLMWISNDANMKECYCYLKDFKGGKRKTLLPHSTDTKCIGLTCGYLVMLSLKTNDYWLVNPITKHELHFPVVPCSPNLNPFRAILIFSPSLSGWLFVLIQRFSRLIWFSIVGTDAWNHVSCAIPIIDLHVFQGKMYTLNKWWGLCEMRLGPEPKLTLLEIKSFPKRRFIYPLLVSSDENLYVVDGYSLNVPFEEMDFREMKWVSLKEKTTEKYAFFCSDMAYGTDIIPESWADSLSQYKRYEIFHNITEKCQNGRFFSSSMWYFPRDCLNINLCS